MEKINYKGFIITIDNDDFVENPRKYDEVATIYSNHKDYDPDDCRINTLMENYDVGCIADLTEKLTENKVPFMPIYAYIHSGISLSTSNESYPFNDRWDSGLFGLIVADPKKFEEFVGSGDIKQFMKNRVEELSIYLNGEVYWFGIENAEGEIFDSCGGFYSVKDAVDAAKESVDDWYNGGIEPFDNPNLPTDELKRVFFEYVTSSPQWGRDLMEKVDEKTLRTFLKEQLKDMLTEDVVAKEFAEWC